MAWSNGCGLKFMPVFFRRHSTRSSALCHLRCHQRHRFKTVLCDWIRALVWRWRKWHCHEPTYIYPRLWNICWLPWFILDWCEQLLEQADLIEHLQLASFHPRYQFEGVPADDLSQFTNRAPYPTINILRQAHLSRALAHVSEPEKIYAENIKTLNKLGRQKVEALCPWGK